MKRDVLLLKKMSEKMATASIAPMCFPFTLYQPKPPAQLVNKKK